VYKFGGFRYIGEYLNYYKGIINYKLKYKFYILQCNGPIGFIGLGNMGGPMAINLLKSDHKVVAFDVVSDCIQPVATEGAQVVLYGIVKLSVVG